MRQRILTIEESAAVAYLDLGKQKGFTGERLMEFVDQRLVEVREEIKELQRNKLIIQKERSIEV